MRQTANSLPPTAAIVLLLLAAVAPHRAIGEALTADELAAVRAAESARVAAIEKVYGAVVAIYGNNRQGGGSGVLYDSDGYALTNFHVVNAAGTEGWAGLADGKLYRWKLIGMDPGGDVAIIKLAGKDQFPVAALGDSDKVRVGDWAMAMGNPFVLAEDQKPTVTLGVVSGIKRYQPGAGTNMLVYGNCIQVDSSINPGNSGGPLFNLDGEVIGINGRGSFKERGRVNVGVGYAISINQIKNFIPDLLATKIAQHGTLDAVFGNRQAGVVCYQLNLDARIASLGLDIGDVLVSFDGRPITGANQFTNNISTLPAGWPVQVVFNHNGRNQSGWLRLDPLPYGQPKKAANKPRPKPKPKKDEPDQPRKVEPVQVKLSLDNPGVIRDAKLNREEAARVLRDWTRFAAGGKPPESVVALRYEEDIFAGGLKIGTQRVVRTADGRYRVDQAAGEVNNNKANTLCWDGKSHWTRTDGGKVVELDAGEAPHADHFGQGTALGTLLTKGVDQFKKIELEGSDKTQNCRAFRLRTENDQGHKFYLWFSLLDDEGRPQVRLLKTATGVDGGATDETQTFYDYRPVSGLMVPHQRVHVDGLSEQPRRRFAVTACETLAKLPEDVFGRPADAKP